MDSKKRVKETYKECAVRLKTSTGMIRYWQYKGRITPKIVDGHYDYTGVERPPTMRAGRKAKDHIRIIRNMGANRHCI